MFGVHIRHPEVRDPGLHTTYIPNTESPSWNHERKICTLTEVFATWCLAYTQSLSNPVRLCLVGKARPEVIASLESLPI